MNRKEKKTLDRLTFKQGVLGSNPRSLTLILLNLRIILRLPRKATEKPRKSYFGLPGFLSRISSNSSPQSKIIQGANLPDPSFCAGSRRPVPRQRGQTFPLSIVISPPHRGHGAAIIARMRCSFTPSISAAWRVENNTLFFIALPLYSLYYLDQLPYYFHAAASWPH